MARSDELLVLACRAGDETAWEELVLRYQRLVYAIARRAGLDEQQAADVFQQVFVLLLGHIDHLEQPGRVASWLTTTTRRETWRVGKRQRAAAASLDAAAPGEEPLEIVDAAPLPDEVLLRLEEQHLVRTAVAALDTRCQTLLTLLFYTAEVTPYADIAARLGVSAGSIGPTRARCLNKLREELKAGGWPD